MKKIYKINFIKELPIFFHDKLNNKKILTISDITLCFYDLDKKMKDIAYYQAISILKTLLKLYLSRIKKWLQLNIKIKRQKL